MAELMKTRCIVILSVILVITLIFTISNFLDLISIRSETKAKYIAKHNDTLMRLGYCYLENARLRDNIKFRVNSENRQKILVECYQTFIDCFSNKRTEDFDFRCYIDCCLNNIDIKDFNIIDDCSFKRVNGTCVAFKEGKVC